MPSAADQPDAPRSPVPDAAAAEPVSAASAEHERILARMILETAEGFGAAGLGKLAVPELARVAARHRGTGLAEPVLIELVEAALRLPFGAAPITHCAELTHAVARALYEDAAARARLERLWHELQASSVPAPEAQPGDVDR